MSDGDVTDLVYIGAERPSFGGDGSKAKAFRRSRGPWTAGTRPAFSGSYSCRAALLRQQGVERSRRLDWRSAKRSLEGSRRVLQSAPSHEVLGARHRQYVAHEVLGARHRQYVARSRAMVVREPTVQLGLTSRLGSARCARSSVAWHALDGCDGGSRKSWRCSGRRSR